MNNSQSIRKKSLFKIILLSFFSLAGIVIFYISLTFVLFVIYKDNISKMVLSSANQKIAGDLTFSNISFVPFRNFPHASLKFTDLTLKENKNTPVDVDEIPVFEIKKAYLSVNIIDLLSSRVNASEISFEDGKINIVISPDSQVNLFKALKTKSEDNGKIEKEIIEKDISESTNKNFAGTKSGLNLQVQNLELVNILINAENQIKKNKVQLHINELQSELSSVDREIISSIKFDGSIDSLVKDNSALFSDLKINLASKLEINTDSIFVKLNDGSFSIGQAQFMVEGTFNSENQGELDLSVTGSDKNFSLFNLILSKRGMNHLSSGNFQLNANIKGKTYIEFPSINASFGMKNVNLINPISKKHIKNLNLSGNFVSGSNEDWSMAKLKVDTLYADLPAGKINLSGIIKNFKNPEINLNIFLSADLTGLDREFNLSAISNLKGKIKLEDNLTGKYLMDEKKYVHNSNVGKISFEDFGFVSPGTIRFDKINGVITRQNNDLNFDNLNVVSDQTEFTIDGEVKNALALLFNKEEEIIGNLQIKSKVFDLPNFLFFDPSIKRDFNHRILDVDIDVIAKTSTSKATKFISFPEIEFGIKKINATVENFLPRLEISSGVFKISESILGFNLKFENFKTEFLNGKFNFTGEYNTSKFQPFYIKAKASFQDIYPSGLFYGQNDTVPEYLDGRLSGILSTELQFPTDTTLLKFIKLNNSDLVYEYSKDTITVNDFSFYFNNIYFNDELNSNPFASLYTSGNLKLDKIYSHSFKFNDVDFNIDIKNGNYEIKSDVVRLFGENAKGKSVIMLSPFSEHPAYKLNFKDVRFRAERMLATFKEDSIFTGLLHLSLNLSSTGSEWDNIVHNINGIVNLSGEDLILNGLDADEIIDKFKRSQSFNMVDLGAVLLAGPVGIAVTKGTDFARIFVLNSGKSTQIKQLISNWNIKDGTFTIDDAAFATNKNRIALKGYIGFAKNDLHLTIALLNNDGCSIFNQEVYGNLDKPTLGDVKVVGAVLAPIKNLVNDVLGTDCDVFYGGKVKPTSNNK